MKLLGLLANAIRRAMKVHVDAVGDTAKNVERRPSEDALRHKRMQCERNALAFVGLHTSLEQSATESKTYTLTELVHRCAQHANRNRGVIAQSVHGVVSGELGLHAEPPVKTANVSGISAADR